MTNEALWYLSRATGTVSIVLFTAVLLLGLTTSGRRRPHGERATVVMAMHRWLSLGALAFLAIHVATAIAETYVSIDLVSALVPFTSSYSPLWVGLGTLAVDLLLAVLVTSWLRHRMAPRTWKYVHWLSYAMWPIAIAHGFMLGTANEPLLRGTTVLAAMAGAAGIAWRATTTHTDQDVRTAIAAQEWS